MPRSPQGRPVIVQAGQSEPGRALAARTAEIIFTVQPDFEAGKAFYADIKSRVLKYGRTPDSVKIMPGVLAVIGKTRAEAQAKWDRMQDMIHPEHGIVNLSDLVGIDLSKYPLDGPLPDAPTINTQQGRQTLIYAMARRENLTIREIYKRVTGARIHRVVIGTAVDAADALEEWFGVAADGFNILPLTFPAGLRDIVEELLPELRRRGLFRKDYEGATLRDHLGLPYPENRYARVPAK